jgi:hypothetical protein
MKHCNSCGAKWLPSATSHNCGTVTISKDAYAALKEAAR